MAVEEILINLANTFVNLVPNMAGALLVLILGFILGRAAGWIVRKILEKSKIDEWISDEDKLSFKFSYVFGFVSRWVIYLLFIQQATEILAVRAITSFISNALTFIFSLVEAALVILIGYTLAIYIKDKLISSKTFYSDLIGKSLFFLIIYLSVALALPFVGIDATLINNILLVIIGSLGLGLAIAIGLGLKDVVRDLGRAHAGRFIRKKGK